MNMTQSLPQPSGLVYYPTSVTLPLVGASALENKPFQPFQTLENLFVVDKKASRVQSLRSSVLTSARLLTQGLQKNGKRYRAAMLTLTYADKNGWNPLHITLLLQRIRAHLKRRGHAFQYVWVMELQKRGAPHYHVMLWLPRGLTLPKMDKAGWWTHGFTNVAFARNPVGYLAKYASKGDTGDFPKGARIFGSGGLSAVQRSIRSWWRLPSLVRDEGGIDYHWKKRKGGGHVSFVYGCTVEPQYKLSFLPSGFVCLVKNTGQKLVRYALEISGIVTHYRYLSDLSNRSLYLQDRLAWLNYAQYA